MSLASAKVPAVIVTGIICLVLGVGAGIVVGSNVDFGQNKQAAGGETPEAKDAGKAGMPGGGMPGGKGGAPGGKAGGKAGGGGGGKGPSPKQQLVQLVVKLETLSKKPLAVEMTPAQKKEAATILADVDAKDALSDDDAKAKLDQLLKLLESQKATLEAAGYRWPGTPFPAPAETPPNPFKDGESAAKLDELRKSLAK